MARSKNLAWLIRMASENPMQMAITRPMKATRVLDHRASNASLRFPPSKNPTSITLWTGRSRNRRVSVSTP